VKTVRNLVLNKLYSGKKIGKYDYLWHIAWKLYLYHEFQSLKLHVTNECKLAGRARESCP